MGPLVVEFPAGVLPVEPPTRLDLFPGSALPRMPWAGRRRVEPLGWLALLGEAVEPVEGVAEVDEPPAAPPVPPPLPPGDPCAHAPPAIRQPASSAVETVR
jgi:hypothetical protein